jgi:NusA-like KH domain protein
MVNTISMQDMRHLNLFGRITQVSTRFCFWYNECIIFSVPVRLLSKAIGENGKNIRRLNEVMGKRVKVIPSPNGIQDARRFIENVISPTKFKEMEITDREIIITAGTQNKAALLGRNKRRLIELQKIVGDFFGRDLRII